VAYNVGALFGAGLFVCTIVMTLTIFGSPVVCPAGHKLNMTRQSYKDSDGNDLTKFKCKICNNNGECQNGAYVCA